MAAEVQCLDKHEARELRDVLGGRVTIPGPDDDVNATFVKALLKVAGFTTQRQRLRVDGVRTYHFEVVSNESASGVMRVGLDSGRVVTNGILTVDTEAQADERSVDGPGNKGAEAAAAALELLAVCEQLAAQ